MTTSGSINEEAGNGSTDDPEPDGPHEMEERQAGDGDDVFESELPDLAGVSLQHLRVSGDSAIAHALRRLADDLSSADEFVAGFQSAI